MAPMSRSPLRYNSTTCVSPWPDADAVTVWKRDVPSLRLGPIRLVRLRLRYAGVRRKTGAAPLAARVANVPVGDCAPEAVAPPGVLAGTARVISAWRLDDGRLAAALSAFAPHVKMSILD